MPRRSKLARMVDQFVATVEELGGRADQQAVSTELAARVDAIATQLRVTKQTVLRSYIPDDWGRELAVAMMSEAADRAAARRLAPPEHVAVKVAGRLVAGLGQAILYAAANDDHRRDFPALDVKQAAEAVSGLGLAIDQRRPGEQFVTVDAQTIAYTRATLETFRDQLRSRAWSSCPCGERHGQAQTDAQVLKALRGDLLLLPSP